MLLAALILRTDRRIVRQLREAKASSTSSAIYLNEPHFPGSWRLIRLGNAGAIRQAQSEHYYLDEAGYAAFRKRRRQRVVVVICILIPLLLIMWLWLNPK
jgi:hypothetical protein